MMNKMSVFRCIYCNKEYNILNNKPFGIPCGDIFCEQCITNLYNKKNKKLICPLHKKEFIIEFNKFSNYLNTLTNINRSALEEKDLGLYCIRHNKKKLKFFCQDDNNFLCENCLEQHEGHKYIEFKLNKDNFIYEINSLRKNFENLKNKYFNEKNKINQYFINEKKNLEEQINKINIYCKNLISLINEKKMQMMIRLKNNEKLNLKKQEHIENIFLISDEKCNFINNEFYYINDELLNKGEYETFFKTKNNFLKLIDNFYLYINKNIFNNEEIYTNKTINYVCPNNGILEKNKLDIIYEENIFGKIEELTINLYNHNPKINSLDIKTNTLLHNYINTNKINQNKKEIQKLDFESKNNSININPHNNNLDTSLLDKKSYINDGDSIIDKQLIESGYTFYIINKEVKNVFKQQDTDQSHNDLIINKDNINYNNKNESFINNLNNINQIRKNKSLMNNIKFEQNKTKNNNNIQNRNKILLNKINESKKKKTPYKLLSLVDNNKEGIKYKKKENDKDNQYPKINKTRINNSNSTYLISFNENNNNNLNIKSEDNRYTKLGKEKLNKINKKRNNSIKKYFDNNNKNKPFLINNNDIKENSLNKKVNRKNITYIYTNNKNDNILSNNLINSYNKEYSNEYNSFIQNNKLNSKNKSQILTDINDESKTYKLRNDNNKKLKSESTYKHDEKNKKLISSKYSYRDLNKRVIIKQDSKYKLNNNEYRTKRGKSTRQKNSFSDMEILL